MPDAQLKAVVGADVGNFVSNITLAQQKLASLYAKLDEAKSRQDKLIDPDNIKAAGQQISAITKQIDAVGNNQGFQNLGRGAQGALGPINDAYSSIRKLAYILPGIGIAGIFNLAFEGLAAAVESFTSSTSGAAKAQEALNMALGEGSAKVQGEVFATKDLAAIALDAANSTSVRAAAFKQLQQEYPGYLGNLSLEKSSYDDIQKALDKVTAALVRQAEIKGLEGAIEDTYKNLNKTVAEGGTTFEKVESNISGFVAGLTDSVGGIKGFAAAFDKAKQGSISHSLGDDAKQAQDQVDLLNKKLQELLKTSITEGDDKLKLKTDPKVADETLSYLEKTKTLIESLQEASKKPLFQQFQNLDQSGVGKSIQGSVEGGLAAVNYEIYESNLKKATADAAKGAISQDTFTQYAAALKDAFDKNSSPNLAVPIKFDLQKEDGQLEKDIKTVTGKLDKNAFLKLHFDAPDSSDLLALNDSLDKLLKNFKSGAIEGVAEAIGNAIGSGGNILKAAGDELLSLIGTALENLGKALIVYGVAKEAVKVSFETLDGYTAIAAGAVAIVAGAALKATATHAFADGGIVTGPTVGLIGEAGPEVIFPLEKLNSFIRGNTGPGNMQVAVSGRISGNDIMLLSARTNKQQGFV